MHGNVSPPLFYFSMLIPTIIRLLDIVCGLGFKLSGAVLIPVQVEFPIDDLEYLWVHTGNLAGR